MSEDTDHLKTATESTRQGITGLFLGLYHYLLGFSTWTKERHIFIQTAVTFGITVALTQIIDVVGNVFFTTFWSQAVYISGIKLRLIPIPLSLLIYILIILLILVGYSLDSSVQRLQSEIDELKSELEKVKKETDEIDK